MKLCNNHMVSLHTMIKRKGMGSFITESSSEADVKAKAWLQGNARIEEIDPLVVASLEIYQKAFNTPGTYVNQPKFCALCEVKRTLGSKADEEWIDNVTDAIYATMLANGVINGS
jgi:hypothetical protein